MSKLNDFQEVRAVQRHLDVGGEFGGGEDLLAHQLAIVVLVEQIIFELDHSIEHGAHINQIISDL